VKKKTPDEQEENEKKEDIEQEKKGETLTEELPRTIETKEPKKEQKIERLSDQATDSPLRLSEQKGTSQRASRVAADLHSTVAGSYAGTKGSSQRNVSLLRSAESFLLDSSCSVSCCSSSRTCSMYLHEINPVLMFQT
jgi:succinylglutamate desuccinylase